MPKLKVFKLVSGFHDSVIAASSRAAALRAWGAKTDLFAMGAAEQTSDPAATKLALSEPGKVFQLERAGSPKAKTRAAAQRPKRNKPPPRKALEAAQSKLQDAERDHTATLAKLDAELKALQSKRDKAANKGTKRLSKLKEAVAVLAEAYEAALRKWEA